MYIFYGVHNKITYSYLCSKIILSGHTNLSKHLYTYTSSTRIITLITDLIPNANKDEELRKIFPIV